MILIFTKLATVSQSIAGVGKVSEAKFVPQDDIKDKILLHTSEIKYFLRTLKMPKIRSISSPLLKKKTGPI